MFNIINCKALLNELKCKQCSKFLSVFPVYYCSAIGNICGRCISTVDWMIANGTLERAVAYEAVAKFLIFPCVNYDNDCQHKLTVNEVEKHEKICKAVPAPCPFNISLGLTLMTCSWRGTAATVVSHLQSEHKDCLQLGLPTCTINTYDSHVKNFFVTIDGQTFLVISKYLKDINKFYMTVMACSAEPNNQCYRYQLEIGRPNDYFLVFRKSNLEKFGNVQDIIDNPENMISVDVSSVLTMLDDPLAAIHYKVSILRKTKKEIGEILGKPVTLNSSSNAKPKPNTSKNTLQVNQNPSRSATPTKPKKKPAAPTPFKLKVGEPSKRYIPPLIPNLQPKNQFYEDLECPICNQYMTSPIYICPTGHSLCNQCKIKVTTCPSCRIPMQDTRNFTLEKLASTMKYPCCYSDHGCTVSLSVEHIKMHELHCNFAYGKCPLKLLVPCNSEDIVDVIGHIRQKHPNLYVETNRMYARDITSVVSTSYWATGHENEIFVICCKHSTSTGPIKFNVLHVASGTKQKYRFCLEFCDQTSKGLKFIISQICKVFPQSPSTALKNCLTIPVDMLKPFIVTKSVAQLYFKINIEKI